MVLALICFRRCTQIVATFEAAGTADLLNAHGTNSSSDDRRHIYLDTTNGGAETGTITSTEFLEQGQFSIKLQEVLIL